ARAAELIAAIDARTARAVPAGEEIDARLDQLRHAVRAIAQAVVKLPDHKLDDHQPLSDLGFDSIRVVQLAHQLSEHTGYKLSPTVIYDHPSLAELVGHLAAQGVIAPAAPVEAPAEVPVEAPVEVPGMPVGPVADGSAIAIIGASGVFPRCRSIAELWAALVDGVDLVTPAPARFGDPAGVPTAMGCIDWVDEFDPAFFEIAPREAKAIDPRQRHLLQECWKALEDAALAPDQLGDARVGVFVGVEQGDYALLAHGAGNLTSNHDGVLAARLSYFLDLKGPVLAINTACSSGLVAVHQACASLARGECDVAIVAAANFVLTRASLEAMHHAGMLSGAGRCATFDQAADGMVPGEAVVALVLKRAADAERDGDPIRSAIVASGVNYDGRTNGITAPSGAAQRALISAVYRDAGLDVGELGYLVAHGTATRLGDPVEVNALAEVLRAATRPGRCALTSTKSNLGHAFAASGLVSLVCLSEALRHATIPGSLHCDHANGLIEWGDRLYVNQRTAPWDGEGRPRLGGVSAFGMSGTNAHVALREHAAPVRPTALRPCYLLVLSAKTAAALDEAAARLCAWLADRSDGELPAIAATLLVGRSHHRHRRAVVVDRVADAIAALRGDAGGLAGVVARDFAPRAAVRAQIDALVGELAELAELVDEAAYRRALGALAEHYVAGHAIPWARSYRGAPPVRLRMPSYPFARGRYWIAEAPASVPVVEAPASLDKPRNIVLSPLADAPAAVAPVIPAAVEAAAPVAPAAVEAAAPVAPAADAAAARSAAMREHDILQDLKAAANVDFHGMVVTLNRTGVMVEHLIPYSIEFADYAGQCGGEVLDLGCAYGIAAIAALERGARVVALDMEQRHLDILGQRVTPEARARLTLVRGVLPDVDFADGRFAAVHASRVIHFLSPDDVRGVLRKMYRWLAPGGRLFLSSDSPYFGYWATRSDDYDARRRAGDPWPGYIADVSRYFDPRDVAGGPPLINALDPEVLDRECRAAGFVVERTGYFGAVGVGRDRRAHGAPGPDMEHVGVIAQRPLGDPVRPEPAGRVARSSDGAAIHYQVHGGGRGAALVLIHGLGCDAGFWDSQLDALAGDHTVVVLDLAGHGRSAAQRAAWTIEAFADDVIAVVRDAGLAEVVLIGHSLGGPIMIEAAARLPGAVRGLIGVDTLHNLEPRRLTAAQIDAH
ncbi:MAG TPA: alpha/beta fold hydrolase, partial [Kofleriaceae bacterium]